MSDEHSLPRAATSTTANGTKIVVALQGQDICKVFGVLEPVVAERLLSQLVNVLHPDPSVPLAPEILDQALALIQGIAPTDATEALVAVMLVASQHAAMDTMRRALHSAQTPGGRSSYLGLSLKAMRTFGQLLEALNQGRGRAITQQIIVQHVAVELGGQAVVGSIDLDRGRG